jgi:phosphoribosylanthranilate isomerase
MIRVKLCGVRTVADALMCANEGADEIGVVFAEGSRRRVDLETARRIRDALPAPVPLVGVFRDASLDEVLRTAREVGLQAAQLHGAWPSAAAGVPLYAALQVTGPEALQPRPGAARVLLDGPAGGSGRTFAWSLAVQARGLGGGQLFIAGGLTAQNVVQAIAEARPDGVDVAGGIEDAAGFKDPARVKAFVAAVRRSFK